MIYDLLIKFHNNTKLQIHQIKANKKFNSSIKTV